MSDPHFAIRRATTADAALLARVGSVFFEQTFGAGNDPEDMRAYLSTAFGERQQTRELEDPNNLFWIAEDQNGEAIGYTQLKVKSETSVQHLERPAELARIYADQRWHGRGVGAQLLATSIDAARDAGRGDIWLGVFQHNARGIAFYEKNGFRIIGEQSFTLGKDVQRDWVMARRLI